MVLIQDISDFSNNKKMHIKVFELFIVLSIILIITSGCAKEDNKNISIKSELSTSDQIENLQNADQYVKVYTGNTSEDRYSFYYDLYDKKGNLVKHDCTYMDEPEYSMVSDDIVKISVQTGTGLSAKWTIYYDLSSGRLSRAFYHVLAEKDNIIAFFDGRNIAITDVFDEDSYKELFELKYDLSDSTDPIKSVVFSDDFTQIIVTYFSGADFNEIKECFSVKAPIHCQ